MDLNGLYFNWSIMCIYFQNILQDEETPAAELIDEENRSEIQVS